MTSSLKTSRRWVARILGGFLILAGFVVFVDMAWTTRASGSNPPEPTSEKSDEKKEGEKKSGEKPSDDKEADDEEKSEKGEKEPAEKEQDKEQEKEKEKDSGDEEDVEEVLRELKKLAQESVKENGKTSSPKGGPTTKPAPKKSTATPKATPRKSPTPSTTKKPGKKNGKSAMPKAKNTGTGRSTKEVGRVPRQPDPRERFGKTPKVSNTKRPGRAGTTPAGTTSAAAGPDAGDKAAPVKELDPSKRSPVSDATTTTRPAPIFDMAQPDPQKRSYRFNYVDEPWEGVLKDFARMSGLSLLKLPEAGITEKLSYLSREEMSFTQALNKLNDLLFEQRTFNNYVILRRENYLVVEPLPDLISNIPLDRMYETFEEFESAGLDMYDVCLTYIDVPDKWTPYMIIDEFRGMFSDNYGTQVKGTQIELTGLVKEHFKFKKVIEEWAQGREPPDDDPRPEMTFELQAQKANDVLQILRGLYPVDGPAPASRRGGKRGATATGIDPKLERAKKLTIIPDIKNNVLYARGPQHLLDEVRETIQNIDIGGFRAPEMEVVQLEAAAASTLVNTLKPILQNRQNAVNKSQYWIKPEVKEALVCNVYPGASGSAVVLVGGQEGIARAKKLVKQYDVPPDWVAEIVELKHADAGDLAPAVIQNFPARTGKGAPRGPQATALSSKKLFISCGQQDYQRILDLVAKLDIVDDEEPHEHMVTLKCGVPSEIAQIVQQIVSGASSSRPVPVPAGGKDAKARARARARAKSRAAATAGRDGSKFFPNDDAKTMIVICADKDWERIETLIKEQDELACQVEPILESIVLEKANASDVANSINQMYPPGPGVPQLVNADAYNNTINIFAKPEFIEKVLPLIREMDVLSGPELMVLKLEHCKAEVIAPILSQSFGTSGARPRVVTRARKGGKKTPVPRSTTTGNTGVRIVAEPVTNALLVTAPPKEQKQIEDLVAEMELKAEALVPVRVYLTPENRSAEEIAAHLNALMGRSTARPVVAKKGKTAAAQVSADNPVAEPLKIVVVGERIALAGPQEEVAEAIQLFQTIDVYDQQYVSEKIRVPDAEETERQLRELLALSAKAKPVVAKGAKKGVRRVATGVSNRDTIQIVANTYDDTLVIRAMPKDWVLINEQLDVILGEARIPDGQDIDIPDDFFDVRLKFQTAWDMILDLEQFIDTDRSKVKFFEGPTEKTLIVQNCKPGEKDKIMRYIAMYDVPPIGYRPDGGIMVLDPEGKMPVGQLARKLTEQWRIREGGEVKLVGMEGADSLVSVIDIHADEKDEEENSKGDEKEEPAAVSPCVLPASMLCSLQAISLGQSSDSDELEPLSIETHCPVCHQSPCVLPAKLMSSLDALAIASVDEEPDPEPEHEHNHVMLADATTSEGEPPREEDKSSSGSIPVLIDPRTKALTDAMPNITLMPDPDTGKIIAMGPQEELEKLQEIMDMLVSSKVPTKVYIFPLQYADVTQAAQLLNNVFNQPQARRAPQRSRQQAGAKGQPQAQAGKGQAAVAAQAGRQPVRAPAAAAKARIKVVPDPRTRSLYVVASAPDIPMITQVLKNIDSRIVGGGEFRFFKLEKLDAELVVESLREMLGINKSTAQAGRRNQKRGQNQPQPNQQMVQIGDMPGTVISADKIKLTAETQTNSILAQASPDTLDIIESFIEKLKRETNIGEVVTRRVHLKNARATDVAEIVESLVKTMEQASRATGGSRQSKGRSGSVSVKADSRTNSIVLVGTLKELEKAEGLIREMDEEGPTDSIRQFVVKGEAQAVAETLKKLYASGPKSDIVITSNEPTNTIIVKAPPPQMLEIEQQIKDMDKQIEKGEELRRIKLVIADAGEMAQKLSNIFGGGGRGKDDVVIAGYGDTLFVRCSDEDFPQIEKVAKDMDKVDDIGVHRFALEHKPAEEVHQSLQTMIAEAMTRGGGGLNLDYVSLVPDPRTNSLVLVGGPKSALLLTQLLSEVDVLPEGDVKETEFIRLQYAKADELAAATTEALKSIVMPIGPDEYPFLIVPDVSSKTLVVTARKSLMPEIKSMVERLDIAGEGDRREHVIEIVNANSEDVASSLQRIFDQAKNDQGNRTAPTIQAIRGSSKIVAFATNEEYEQIRGLVEQVDIGGGRMIHTVPMPEQVPAKTVSDNINKVYGSGNQDGIKAEYHEPTNTLLVYGTEAEYEKVREQLIVPLSKSDAIAALNFYMIQLKYAVADEVAQTLQDFFDKKAGNRRGPRLPPWMGGGSSASELRENQVTITAEPTSNMLLVYATETTKELIDDLLVHIDTGGEDRVFQMVELEHMDATEMLEIMTEILKVSKRSKPDEDRQFVPWWMDREEEEDDKTVLAGDMRLKAIESTNSIIVAGREEGVTDAVAKIKELDVPSDKNNPQMYTFVHARAGDVADVLKQVFVEGRSTRASGGRRSGRGGRSNTRTTSGQQLAIVPVDASNSILVRGKTSDVSEVLAMAKTLDLQMQDEVAGVRIVQIPTGHNVENLAQLIETQINSAEDSIKDRRSDYRPDRVTIGADRRSNTILVSASKSKFEEVEALVKELVEMGPPGGRIRRYIKLETLSPDQARQLIEQLQQGQDGSSNRSGSSRGRSSGRRSGGRGRR